MFNYLFTKTPLTFFVQNLWRDEAFSFLMARQDVLDILQTTAVDFNPPLYYIVLHYWMQIFGTSDIAMRSLSLLFYMLTIFVIFEIMVLVFKLPVKKALLYFVLIILNPFLLYYAFEARMYMMVTFFVTLSYFALWTKKKRLYIFAITTALYTHYFAVFILGAQIMSFFLTRDWKLDPGRWTLDITKIIKDLTSNLYRQISQFIVPIAIFSPWAIYLLSVHQFGSSDFWIIKPPETDILYLPFVLYTGYERVFGAYYHTQAGYTDFHRYINFILTGLIILGTGVPLLLKFLSSQKWIPNDKLFPILLWSFFPPVSIFLISLVGTPLYHPRYFIFSSVGFILLIILSIEYIIQFMQKVFSRSTSHIPHVSLALIIFYLLFITNQFNTLNQKYRYKRNVSRMYQEIEILKTPEDKVYVTNELDFHLAQYYANDSENVYIFNKSYEEIPSYVGKVLIPRELVTNQYPVYPAKAFVVHYDYYEIVSSM